MKADRARRIRDWIALSKLNIGEEDSFNMEVWKSRNAAYQEFVRERVPSPVGKVFFDSREELWTTNPFLINLQETQRDYLVNYFKQNNRKLYYLSFTPLILVYVIFVLPVFLMSYLQVFTTFPTLMNALFCMALFILLWFSAKQIVSRSEAVLFNTDEKYAENDEFATRWEYAKHAFTELRHPQQWAESRYDVDFNVSFGPFGRSINGPYEKGSATYEWKHIKEGKFIITDKATGLEAPLLPGASPYVKESLFS